MIVYSLNIPTTRIRRSRWYEINPSPKQIKYNLIPSSRTVGARLARHQLHVIIELKSRLRVVLTRDKVDHQRVLDSKHRVVGQVLVLSVEDLGCQGAVAIMGCLDRWSVLHSHVSRAITHNNVNMSRPERVSIHQLEHLPSRTYTITTETNQFRPYANTHPHFDIGKGEVYHHPEQDTASAANNKSNTSPAHPCETSPLG